MDAREVALLTLNACERQGGWSDGILKKQLAEANLDSRDAALATQLCFGILQNQMLIDFYLSHFSNLSLKRMESRVVQILRIGAYQMLFLNKIPQRAAVDSAVILTKNHCKNQRASGMVNGILRSLARSIDNLPTIPDMDSIPYLSTLYSHPEWLVNEFVTSFGIEGAEALMRANNSQPPMTAMVNTTITTAEHLTESLERDGVTVQAHPWLSDCLILSSTGNIELLDAFEKGLFYIQDVASRLAILVAEPKAGDRVLDTCAAPGGKSFAIAIAMGDTGEIISCDLHPHKKKLIQNGADRLRLTSIKPMTADGKNHLPQWENNFDLVVVDAPCSGFGVIRKKPDIRYKDPKQLKSLPDVQRDILEIASGYVVAGGTLLYSTCTMLDCENQDIVHAFLKNHPEFTLEAFTLPDPVGHVADGMVTLLPHLHGTDGFFISKLRKEDAR